MPLNINFEDRTGLFRNSAFVIISSVHIDWTRRLAIVQLDLFNSSIAWLQKKEPFGIERVIFSTSPDELGKTFDDFFALALLSDSRFNFHSALETHLSMLSRFSGSTIVPFPS